MDKIKERNDAIMRILADRECEAIKEGMEQGYYFQSNEVRYNLGTPCIVMTFTKVITCE